MTGDRGPGASPTRTKKPGKDSLEHSQRHIEALYEISKLLTRFDDVEVALPRIIDIVATRLPLRTAICIQQRDEDLVTLTWACPTCPPDERRIAEEKARNAYIYLTGRSAERLRPIEVPPSAARGVELADLDRAARDTKLLTLPLAVERAPTFGIFQLGALFVESAEALDKIDIAFVNAVANQFAIAIDRRRAWEQLLHRAQVETTVAQSKQVEAEISQNRERLVSAASALLARSLDYKANIEALARLLVPTLADWCMIDIVATVEPEIIRVASTLVVHADKAKEAFCQEIIRRCPPDPNFEHGVPNVVRTGLSEIHPDVSNASWIPVALGIEHPPLLREVGARSYMCVPLKGRGGVLGAVTLIYNGSGRRYGHADLDLAENFAWRAAAAIDNARLYEEAQKAIRGRDDLLGLVSHDLRNPLGLIVLHTAALQKRLEPAQLSDAARKQIEGIRRSAERMTRLIQDLLDSASIEAGHVSIQRERVAIVPLVNEAIEAHELLATGKALCLEVDVAPDVPAVFADAARLQQILGNLVTNAIKFTPGGGSVVVRAERQGEFVRFSVSDTGPGISEEDLPHVFDRFWQARRTAGLGTGLGLFISRGLVEAQGGKLWLESTIGRGTTFYFTLPIASATDPDLVTEK